MTSRFRSNWAKEGPKSTSPTFESVTRIGGHRSEDDYRRDYYEDEAPATSATSIGRRNANGGSRSAIVDRAIDDRNGNNDRGKNGAGGCYGDQRELHDESESPDRSYYRRFKEEFRCRGTEVEDSSRERRAPIGKKIGSGGVVAAASRFDFVEDDEADATTNVDSRLVASTMMTNGNAAGSSGRSASNGSSKQVKRHEERRADRQQQSTSGSLTRELRADDSFPAINPRAGDATNRSAIGNTTTSIGSDRSNGRSRERSKKSSRDRSDDYYTSGVGSVTRGNEINDYGSMDRGRNRHRDHSHSPIDEVANGNGDTSRRSDVRRREARGADRFYSPGGSRVHDEQGGSMDRRSRRHAEGRSFSPIDDNDDRMTNGNCDIVTAIRLERREKRPKDEDHFGSIPRRSSRSHADDRIDFRDNDDDVNGAVRTNGTRGENGHSRKYREIVDDENSQSRKGSSKRKSHNHHKASPEDFDVQIHRYERALRAPRRDSDLSRKNSFKEDQSDLSRKNSFDDHHSRSTRDVNATRKSSSSSHRRRDSDVARRGSSEDRDQQVSRKSSFKSPETTTRKSSLTSRGVLDPTVNHRNNNGSSTNREVTSESLRKDRDPSITRRRSSRTNNGDDDDDYDEDHDHDHDRSSWRNDRHSRPLTPPALDDREDREGSRDRRIRTGGQVAGSFKDRRVTDTDDFSRNFAALDHHNDSRGKTQIETIETIKQGRDRFSSATRRVVTTSRSFNESRGDVATRGSRVDSKLLLRDIANNDDDDEDDVDDDDDRHEDRRDAGFSTIDRNGTTVIRIRTNSESPVGHLEARTRRRTGYQEMIGNTRYRKYEDEAEDEYEDDEPFERRDSRRTDDELARDYKIGPRRLWSNRDGGVQITDLDDGQPCLHCGETCPGFSPHSWRKNCTSCKCPREAHDVCHEEWVSVRARLGLKGEGPNNYVGFDPRDRGLTWAPPGLPPGKVEEYFAMLPEISVPRIGTPGERHRDRQLATQLPKQDLARAYCRHLDTQHSASADDFMAARNEIALDIGSVKEIHERGHECGVCHEPLKCGSLVVSASKLGLSYHPSCFQCTQCRELLVDLAYCVHDDALYCERHYAEQLKPRCAACDELIFSGEYTKAMNKDWHSGHFCCWQCDESLTGQRYVLRDEHPYCIKCYESVFANGCEECSKIIGIDSKDLSYKDKHWHEACFLCNKCRVSLVDKQFGSKVDKIYCGNCYDAQFASRCDGCGEIFRAGTKKMEYKTRQWHEKCFCCVVCKNPIGTKSFIPREQEIYCAGCYEDKFATRCVKCNKIITSGGVTYKNEPWHRDCFTCSNCNNSLAGQRFTSRDDKPYCAECFGELFAKRCTACTKPITGIGGTRFISFEDRHWHNNCFICAGCQTSLVGRGFITDGDDIICPECAKQKLSE